jgi:hypothetical protein
MPLHLIGALGAVLSRLCAIVTISTGPPRVAKACRPGNTLSGRSDTLSRLFAGLQNRVTATHSSERMASGVGSTFSSTRNGAAFAR